MTKIIFAQKATDALLSQAKYIYSLTLDVNKADRYLDEMKHYISSTLQTFPKLGRPAPEIEEHTRKLVYKRYTILYRIETTQLLVLTIYKENLPSL